MSKHRIAFVFLSVIFLVLGSAALQGQDTAKAETPPPPQPLSPEEFEKVIQSTNKQDWMKIQAMTDEQVKSVLNSKVLVIRTGAIIEEWQTLYLNGLTYITDEQAKQLAKNEVNLSLDGLKSLTDEQAKNLASYKGKFIPRSYQADQTYQRLFGTRAGGILSLNGITSLTDEQAKWLGKSKSFELDLNSLTSLTDVQAKSLGYFPGAILQINSLKTLTDKQAKALAQFQGKIAMTGLDKASSDLFLKYGGVFLGKN